jgi:3,4-dihydroxy 2-butanone 4-phosphate synthase/GTP cyclohydrolase II
VWPNPENVHYLRTKRDRMGHELGQLEHYEGGTKSVAGKNTAVKTGDDKS